MSCNRTFFVGFSQVLFFQKKRNHHCWLTRFHNIHLVCPYNCQAVLYTDFDYDLLRLPNLDYWLMAGVTGQQVMFTPHWHLIASLIYPGVRICHALIILSFFGVCFFLDYMIDYDSLSLPFHVPNFYHKLNPKTQSGLPRTYMNLSILN